jgi:aconitate hydratase
LVFDNEADDKIQEDDTINFTDLVDFAPGKPLEKFVHTDGVKM